MQSCPNLREFLQYRKVDKLTTIPFYSKFCAEHNRNIGLTFNDMVESEYEYEYESESELEDKITGIKGPMGPKGSTSQQTRPTSECDISDYIVVEHSNVDQIKQNQNQSNSVEVNHTNNSLNISHTDMLSDQDSQESPLTQQLLGTSSI
jgi:hypothetical protein